MRRPACTWRSSWTATAAGPRRAGCRARRGAPPRRRGGAARRGGGAAPRHPHADPLRLLRRQLEAAGRRSARAHAALPALSPATEARARSRHGVRLSRHRPARSTARARCAPPSPRAESGHRGRRARCTSRWRSTTPRATRSSRRRRACRRAAAARARRFAALLGAARSGGPTRADVDLLIRTGGEQRLSDFLLWESAYAELLFIAADLARLRHRRSRRRRARVPGAERRFGSLPAAAPAAVGELAR